MKSLASNIQQKSANEQWNWSYGVSSKHRVWRRTQGLIRSERKGAVQHKGQLSQSTADNLGQRDNSYQQFSTVSTRSAHLKLTLLCLSLPMEWMLKHKLTIMHCNNRIAACETLLQSSTAFREFYSSFPCILLHHLVKLPPKYWSMSLWDNMIILVLVTFELGHLLPITVSIKNLPGKDLSTSNKYWLK